jgi:Cell morphogenesis N-terminal
MQVDVLFLSTMLRLLDDRIPLDAAAATRLQERAFHFILEIDHFVAAPELTRQREQLLGLCRAVLGSLSRVRLLAVVGSFQEHLARRRGQDPPQRPAAVALCSGVARVQFVLASNRDVNAATQALPLLSPLQPMVTELSKKAALQYALCDALAAILRGVVENGAA